MSSRKPKTTGSEWLFHSLSAFNGSGYADDENADTFLESYQAYKLWNKKPDAAVLVSQYSDLALVWADKLLEGNGAGRTPTDKALLSFAVYYPKAKNWLQNT